MQHSPILKQIIHSTCIVLPCTIILIFFDQLPFLTQDLHRGQTLGRDAFNFWAAGNLAISGRISEVYDNPAFIIAIRDILGPSAGLHTFPYPPPALLFVAAFGWIPYWLALFSWSLIGLLVFALATTSKTPHINDQALLLAMIAPLTLCNIALGQNGLLSAALFISGLRLAPIKPVLAGVLIGCLAYKPMLALLLPLALLLEKRWKTIISAGITVAFLCISPVFLWGPRVWIDYLQLAAPFQGLLLEQGTGLAQLMKLTSFMSMHLLGFSTSAAYQVQIGFALIALGLLITYGLRRKRKGYFDGLDITILATTTMLILPYTHFYDMTMIAGGLLLASQDNKIREKSPLIRTGIFGLLWALPIIGLLLNILSLPITPLILLASLFLLCYYTPTNKPPEPHP